MKYKKYVMMFLAGTMALTSAVPMVALAEDAAPAAESEATEENASAEKIEESEEKEEAETEDEETEEEAEAEEGKEAAKEAVQTVKGIKNEAVEVQPMLLGATETIPMAEEETAQDLEVGVYSVDYGIMNASNPTNPSMAGGVQDGNMIVEVSEGTGGQRIYTYYMRVKEMAVATIKAHMVELKLGDENGESAEVYATTSLDEKPVPQVFRFTRTEKEDQLKVTLVSSFMTAPTVIAMKWDTATTENAAIPKGDSTPDTPEPPAATILAPIITPAKTEAENDSEVEVSITTEQALTYGGRSKGNQWKNLHSGRVGGAESAGRCYADRLYRPDGGNSCNGSKSMAALPRCVWHS